MPETTAEPAAPKRTGSSRSRSSEVLISAVELFVLAPSHERAEIRAFADLLVGLLPDAVAADRAHVAMRLAHRADTPPAVARLLACDAIDIAREVVLRSPVLTSGDLVEIMRRGPGHVAAVADRLGLAPDVAVTLTRNFENDMATARLDPSPALGFEPPAPVEIRAIVEEAMAQRPVASCEVEAEVALQRALDDLAAELAAESASRADEEEALRAVHEATPVVPGEIDAFLKLDPAARWRVIQDHSSTSTLSTAAPRRRRSGDPAVVGARLFAALVAGDRVRLTDDLAELAEVDRGVAERILTDRHGEALAITLAALGVDERTATSILLLHGGAFITLAHMQDLSAMAGRIGWRTAEHIVATWRGGRGLRRGETLRVLDPADRRGTGREAATGDGKADEEMPRRRRSDV